jgi:hypothetical protein
MEPHDHVLSTCAAGRDRDWEYLDAAVQTGVVRLERLLELAPTMPVSGDVQRRIAARVRAAAGGGRPSELD